MSACPGSPCGRRRGRPRGTVAPVAEIADRNGQVRVLVGLPERLAAALQERAEMALACHIRCALLRALHAGPRPSLLDVIDYGPRLQVRLPRELLEQVEQAYGVAEREAAIITAVAAYVGGR
ncbi:MAG: hypothetical protein IT372_31490 [Polyangiaceae bacterium]|nr:hypothetical protein [Polyangiaceae bacterium]